MPKLTRLRARVLVVGAGPVGLTLALDLAWREVDVLVLETRARGEPPSVKCNHVAARTMEVFRRLGIARAVREAPGLPADHPNGVAFRTTTTGTEFARIHIPCLRDRYTDRSGGDAAHIWVPFAGCGMNAGIADAVNLSWQLAGVLAGWARPEILAAYEAERQPITEQVSRHAMATAQALARARAAVPAGIEADGPGGDAVRAAFGRTLIELNTPQYCCGGLNFGYFYDCSPIIAYDGEAPPSYSMDGFTPSDVPGCRTPHLWLRDGRSLYDALGSGFTLLRLDPRADADPIARAAARRGVPLSVLDVEAATDASAYRHKLVLSRPDQHVAWRGDRPPASADALVARICAET